LVQHVGRLPFLTLAADEKDNIGASGEPDGYYYHSNPHVRKEDIQVMAEMEEWLQERASQLERQGVNVLEEKIVTAHDQPSEVILQFAAEHGCDFIVMAAHKRNLLERAIQGSVTNSVVRSAGIPILAMTPEPSGRPGHPANVTRLSVLLDGSAFAESALSYVKELARRMSLEIVLIRWLTMGQGHPGFAGTGSALANTESLRANSETPSSEEALEARQYLQAISNGLTVEGFQVQWEIPKAALDSDQSELSHRCANSIIALASHGRSGISRWIEGSVAEDLLRDSGCPVLIIPAALAEQERPEEVP
jgi:nucleotide-binding universal stress UspA family protein